MRFQVLMAVSVKMAVFWVIIAFIIAPVMEAAGASEKSCKLLLD
jgi:hypothetical protein